MDHTGGCIIFLKENFWDTSIAYDTWKLLDLRTGNVSSAIFHVLSQRSALLTGSFRLFIWGKGRFSHHREPCCSWLPVAAITGRPVNTSWRIQENGWLTRAGGVQVVEGFPSCLPGWGGGLFLLLVEEEVEEVGAWWLTEVLVEDEPEVAAVVVVTLSVVDAWKGSVSSCSLLVVIACKDC